MEIDGFATSRARCVLAPNPSFMTLEGTNTWVLAEPGTSSAIVIDPGPDDEGHLGRVAESIEREGRRVAVVLLTHRHSDHSGGAARFAELVGAPVRAFDPEYRIGDAGLADGDTIAADGLELQALATPGHSSDSVSFWLPADGVLLTGDTVLGRGTTVLAEDGGRLGDYLRSLDKLRAVAESARMLLPAHGPPREDPVQVLDYYIDHRRERLAEIEAALAAGDRTPKAIVERVYADVDRKLRGVAEWSVRAQLDYLAERGDLPADVSY